MAKRRATSQPVAGYDMTGGMTIRDATTGDLGAIAVLWKEFMDFHKARDPHFTRSPDGHDRFREYIGSQIESDSACVLVAEHRGAVVAYCLSTVADNPPVFEETRYGLICDLAVSETFRRHGVGERMVSITEEWFKRKGIRRIEVRFALSNEVSTAFWAKTGYQPYLGTSAKDV